MKNIVIFCISLWCALWSICKFSFIIRPRILQR